MYRITFIPYKLTGFTYKRKTITLLTSSNTNAININHYHIQTDILFLFFKLFTKKAKKNILCKQNLFFILSYHTLNMQNI